MRGEKRSYREFTHGRAGRSFAASREPAEKVRSGSGSERVNSSWID